MRIQQRLKICLLFSFLLINAVFAGNIRLSQSSLTFDTSYTSVKDSLSFWIINDGADTVYISDINTFEGVFSLRDTQFVVLPGDSVGAWVYFSSVQNVSYSDVAIIETAGIEGSYGILLSGVKKYSGTYYNSTQGLWGEPLKTALKNLVTGQTNRHYDGIRDMMFLQVDPVGGQLECVYTGRKIAVTNRSDMQSSGNFNTEHSWPQSLFNQQEPERADLNHLFPTDETANNKRSNYPFDVVVGTPDWTVGGSKLGRNSHNAIVFEPRDVHKGDLARAMFYFVTRYQNWGSFLVSASVNQEATFRIWNKQDPVSSKETTRNEAIAQPSVQGKRNPFIDHPEFVDRISSFAGTATVASAPKNVVSPTHADFGTMIPDNTGHIQVAIVNAGNAVLNISSVSSSNPVFLLTPQSNTIPAHNVVYADLRYFATDTSAMDSGSVTINSNDGTTGPITITVVGRASGVAGVSDRMSELPHEFLLEQNYPNPFNPTTMIHYQLPVHSFVTLKVYNIFGQEVAILLEGVEEAGYKSVEWNAHNISSGVYIYHLITSAGFSSTKKMLLMR